MSRTSSLLLTTALCVSTFASAAFAFDSAPTSSFDRERGKKPTAAVSDTSGTTLSTASPTTTPLPGVTTKASPTAAVAAPATASPAVVAVPSSLPAGSATAKGIAAGAGTAAPTTPIKHFDGLNASLGRKNVTASPAGPALTDKTAAPLSTTPAASTTSSNFTRERGTAGTTTVTPSANKLAPAVMPAPKVESSVQ